MKKISRTAPASLLSLGLLAGLSVGCQTGPGVTPPDAEAYSAGPAGSHAAPEGSPARGGAGGSAGTGSSTN